MDDNYKTLLAFRIKRPCCLSLQLLFECDNQPRKWNGDEEAIILIVQKYVSIVNGRHRFCHQSKQVFSIFY